MEEKIMLQSVSKARDWIFGLQKFETISNFQYKHAHIPAEAHRKLGTIVNNLDFIITSLNEIKTQQKKDNLMIDISEILYRTKQFFDAAKEMVAVAIENKYMSITEEFKLAKKGSSAEKVMLGWKPLFGGRRRGVVELEQERLNLDTYASTVVKYFKSIEDNIVSAIRVDTVEARNPPLAANLAGKAEVAVIA
jgi:hypothetical protein